MIRVPAEAATRSWGSVTVRNARRLDRPSERATSSCAASTSRSAATVGRNTYGNSPSPNTRVAPPRLDNAVDSGKNRKLAATQVYELTKPGTASGMVNITIHNGRQGRSVRTTSTASPTPSSRQNAHTVTSSARVFHSSGRVAGVDSSCTSSGKLKPSRSTR